jgi:hypothetical protein
LFGNGLTQAETSRPASFLGSHQLEIVTMTTNTTPTEQAAPEFTPAQQAAIQAMLAAQADMIRAQLQQQGGGKSVPTTIKMNSSGGLFIRSASFDCYSSAKKKRYIGSVNMPLGVAKALFGKDRDQALLEQISAFLDSDD